MCEKDDFHQGKISNKAPGVGPKAAYVNQTRFYRTINTVKIVGH